MPHFPLVLVLYLHNYKKVFSHMSASDPKNCNIYSLGTLAGLLFRKNMFVETLCCCTIFYFFLIFMVIVRRSSWPVYIFNFFPKQFLRHVPKTGTIQIHMPHFPLVLILYLHNYKTVFPTYERFRYICRTSHFVLFFVELNRQNQFLKARAKKRYYSTPIRVRTSYDDAPARTSTYILRYRYYFTRFY